MKPKENSSESITDRQYKKMIETPIPRLILALISLPLILIFLRQLPNDGE